MKIICSILSLLVCLNGISQPKMHGHVGGPDKQPLPFASIVVLSDSTFVEGVSTDKKGDFTLSFVYQKDKQYTLHVSMIGYKPFSKDFIYPATGFMSQVFLSADSTTLKNVTVTSARRLITRKSDRFIINVENSFLADGNSALDVLQKSPGIWVDNNGSIRIKGNQPVTVMINDIVQRMSEDELAEYLRTLRSEDISRIEVIPNPPSEFEASGTGGIIHIILKKARKDGLNASVFSQYYQQGSKPLIGTGLSFDYKAGAFYLFGNGAISRDQNQSHGMSETIYPDQDLYTSSTHRNNDNRRQQYRLAMAYDLSKTQSLTLQTTGSAGQMFQLFNTNADFKSANPELTGTNDSYWVRKPTTSSTNLNYSWKIDSAGTLLKLIADYTTNLKTETNQFAGLYNDTLQNTIYRTSNPGNTKIFTLQADYTKPLRKKIELKAGAKYVGIRRDNITQREDELTGGWVTDTALGNHFIYSENLLMLYASMEKSIKKTNIKLGLRAEETLSSGNSVSSVQQFSRNYFGLFPSLFVTHNDIYFSYSRRLTRPAFNELNPYRFQITQFTAIIGNPDLQPQYSHNIELGYNFPKGYSASVFYTYTSGMIAQTATPIGNNMIENQYQNFNNSQQYGINLSAPFNVRKWWTVNSSGSFFHLGYRINNFAIDQTSFSFRISQGFRLGKRVSVDWDNYYRSPYVNANSKVSNHFSSDIGATVRVFKTHGRIRLTLNDIFNTTREQEKTDYDQTHIEFYQKRQTRNVGLYFSYNFNLGKVFSKKKIDQANSDEKNRIGN